MRASLLAGAIAAVLPVVSGYGAFMIGVLDRYTAHGILECGKSAHNVLERSAVPMDRLPGK